MSFTRTIYFALGVLAVAIVLLLAYIVWLARVYYSCVRSKGYRSPLVQQFFLSAPFVSTMVGLYPLVIFARSGENGWIVPTALLAGPFVFTSILLYVGARLVPVKKRSAGARKVKFPFRLAAWLLPLAGIALLITVGVVTHWHWQPLLRSFQMLLKILGASVVCIYLAMRASLPAASKVRETDTRAPVLYLRAFNIEDQLFVHLSSDEARKYSSFLGTKHGATLEQYFSKAIHDSIGPFVALGDPFDYVAPEGASRTYEADTDWQNTFTNLAREAACIIVQTGASANLKLEWNVLRSERLLAKVFILTSPATKVNALRRFGQNLEPFVNWIKGIKPVVWSEFASGMTELNYRIDAAEPDPGSIFTFQNDGTAVLLAAGAEEPGDFVAVMQQHLASNQFRVAETSMSEVAHTQTLSGWRASGATRNA